MFKPRDEGPYAPRNPRWLKYLQRLVFPCCFGRPFLVPNHCYLSEVGAYIVDRQFGVSHVLVGALALLFSTPSPSVSVRHRSTNLRHGAAVADVQQSSWRH